ncbi:MAG: right-handed parallel beta-helix repeat-containing protein [Thermoplasmata archaeon]|nr:MAG: right-handed parallel beta-helix repeat-containing protein [Thermoplasmata archaeon]
MFSNNFNTAPKQTLSLIIILGLILSGFFIGYPHICSYNASAGSGSPPINGTTNDPWYVDRNIIRNHESLKTSDIQINDSASMNWNNITAEVNGNITVNSTGYFNMTNCLVVLSGNLTIHGSVTLKNVTLKLNCTTQAQHHIEIKGSMYIFDLDEDNATASDASVITAVDTNYNFLFWVRKGARFVMAYSDLHECGHSGPPYSPEQYGLFVQTNNTVIENNTITNNYLGVHYYFSSYNYLANNTIKSNTDGVRLTSASRNTIFNNIISNNGDDGIELDASKYNTIEHNTITNNIDDGVDVDTNSDYNTISNNTITSNTYGTMITGAKGNIVINNTYTNNAETGVGLYSGSTENYIVNNFASGSKAGFSSVLASGNFFIKNTAKSNQAGFGIRQSTNNSITHNKIYSNIFYGIVLEQSSANNEVHYNNISSNTLGGIQVNDAASKVNATRNWWGDSSGPFHPTTNPSGTGNRVSNNVIYNPWLKKKLEDINTKINTTDNTTATEDSYYEVVYQTIDADIGDVITWRKTDNSSWLKWGDNNNTLYGTPTNADVGTFWVCINVTYGYGGSDEHNFTLTVSNVDPIIITTDITSRKEDMAYSNDYNSTDDGFGTITWSLATNAKWLSIDIITGNLTGTPLNSDVGSYWVNVTVNDGNGGIDFSNFTLKIINVNDAPQIGTNDVVNIQEDDYYEVTYTATDEDIGDIISWIQSTNASWLNWGASNHTLYGTPHNIDVGSYWVRINVSDGNGGYDEHNFTLKVINTNDKPQIITPDITIIDEDRYYEVVYSALDVDSGDTLTWTQSTNATWLHWGPTNHTLYGTPRNNDVGSFWVRINVSDGKNGYDEHYFILTVRNTNDAPHIVTSDITSTYEDHYYRVVYTATDDDLNEILTWSLSTSASWLHWGAANNTLYGTPRNNDVGSYQVRITVSDDSADYDEHDFILEVMNVNDPPTITDAPTSLQVKPLEDTILDLTLNVDDVDNDISELELIVDSEYSTVIDLKIIFNYPASVSSEYVVASVSDGIDNSEPHYIHVTVISISESDPGIIAHSPEGIYIPVGTNIEITFNKDMNHSSVEGAFSINPSIKGKFSWIGPVMAFDPDELLAFNTTYSVTIDTTATDLDGKSLSNIYSWDFTTEIYEIVDNKTTDENKTGIDSDNDGHPDKEDAFPDDPYEWLDSDNDGIGNNADPDDDNDGISDSIEKILGSDPESKDTDNDGHDDGDDAYPTDPKRWEKESIPRDEKSIRGIVAISVIIIIILIVLLLAIFLIVTKTGRKGKSVEPMDTESDAAIVIEVTSNSREGQTRPPMQN